MADDHTRSRTRRAAPAVIDRPEQLADLASRLSTQALLAFDTEFIRERTFFPELGLLQVADSEHAWLVDPLALDEKQLEPLLNLLTNPAVLKVAHAVEQDQECLHHQYGIVASPVLDTAIAAALTGQGDQVGLAALLRKVLNVKLPKGHTRTDWLLRPLPGAMVEYALADVEYLVELAAELLADLDRFGRRKWAMELSARVGSALTCPAGPEAIAERLASTRRLDPVEYAVLLELVRWRESEVRRLNVPRGWLADDQLLVRLASARPGTREDLSHFRGLGTRVRRLDHGALLAAIRRGEEVPPGNRPVPPSRVEPDADDNQALSVLKCFIGLLAREHQIPARLLVDSDSLVDLLKRRFSTLDALRSSGLLSEGAPPVFAEEVLAFLNGRRALRLLGGRATRYDPEADKP